jgi:hypothetical protein
VTGPADNREGSANFLYGRGQRITIPTRETAVVERQELTAPR